MTTYPVTCRACAARLSTLTSVPLKKYQEVRHGGQETADAKM